MANPKKIIVVVGATGNQGGSVAHTFLALPTWHVRCITRDLSSPASKDLATLGAEVVQADLFDISSLSQAFANANAIFLNTNFWERYRADAPEDAGKDISLLSYTQEVSHGTNAAVAAAGVPSLDRFVYSSLSPLKKHSQGKYSQSQHANSKCAIVEYIETSQPELAKKTSIIYLGAYNTNALLTPNLDPASGMYKFVVPMKKETRIPIVDPKTSTGPFVRCLIEDEEPGTNFLAHDKDSYLNMEELVGVWSSVTGKEARLVAVSIDFMHKQFGVPMELLDTPAYISEYGYTAGIESLVRPAQLKNPPATKSFAEWLKENN